MRKWLVGIAAVSLVASLAGLIFLSLAYANLRKQVLTMAAAGTSYSSMRLAVIQAQLSQVKKPGIVMGDSIVESAVLPAAICGHPVVNAGLSGARIDFFAEWASRLTKESEPALAILVVGLNDAGKDYDEKTFRAAYAATLRSALSPMAVGTIAAARGPRIEPANIERINTAIGQLAGDRTLIELHQAVVGESTIDGIHLNGDGYKLWTPALLSGARRALNCENQSVAADTNNASN